MKNEIDYINGNKFTKLGHVVFPIEGKYVTDEILQKDCIIFCQTDFHDYLFDKLRHSFHKYVLISHCSDYTIDFNRFSKKPNCIKKWFAENAEYDHPDLISIPIGLENTVTENGATKGGATDPLWFIENIERFKSKPKIEDVVYCAWNSNNNSERSKILDKLELKYYHVERLPFKEHCKIIANY